MSAYIVDNSTINKIVAAIQSAANHGDYTRPYCKPNSDLLHIANNSKAGQDFGQTLYAMNVDAVCQRYPGEPVADLPGPIDAGYKFQSVMPPQPHQFMKSLACFLYQCTEGDVDTLPMYKALREYQSQLALHMVENSPAYEHAEWG